MIYGCPEYQAFSKGLGINFINDATRAFYNADISRNFVTINGFKHPLPRYYADRLIVCPVQKLAKRLYAQEMANAEISAQYEQWQENKTYHQTFEQFRYQKKVAHNDFFMKKVADRKKFK